MPQIIDQATLEAEVATRLGRSDLTTATLAVMIQLAVAQVNRDATNAGAFIGKETTVTGVLTANSESLTIPTGLQQVRVFELLAPYAAALVPMSIQQFIDLSPDNSNGVPERYAVFGDNFIVNPTPTSAYAYRLRYLGLANTAYLCASYPDVIFYSTLLQGTDYARDDASIARYSAAYTVALKAAMKNEQRKRYGHMPPQLSVNQAQRFNIMVGR